MNNKDDDILNINFEDEKSNEALEENILDIEIEPEDNFSASSQAELGRGEVAQEGSAVPPMIALGYCPKCGYAFRPLETECPRCAKYGQAAFPQQENDTQEAALSEETDLFNPNSARQKREVWGVLLEILAFFLLVGAAGIIMLALWMQPEQQAIREYRKGLQAQFQGEFEKARKHYQQALKLDPKMGLAAFFMGTTYLRVGVPEGLENFEAFIKKAAYGDTKELDKADEWFRKTVEIGNSLPAEKRLLDQKINTPAKLRAYAHAFLGLTALIRFVGAIQGSLIFDPEGNGDWQAAYYWLDKALKEARSALIDDPQNSMAEEMLRSTQELRRY